MAEYCFASAEGKYALFAEACMRGWIAAVRDFPHLKSREEGAVQALAECDVLRSKVCCIPAEETYQRLVSSAWVNTYLSLDQVTKREIVVMASVLKGKLIDEMLALVRPSFSSDVARAEIDRAYAQFIKATS